MKITIAVKPRHIKHGKRKSNDSCPLALATKETTGYDCSVELDHMYVDNTLVYLPVKARRFIAEFDYGTPVRPITFTVDL